MKAKMYDFDPAYHAPDGYDHKGDFVIRDVDALSLANGELSRTFAYTPDVHELDDWHEDIGDVLWWTFPVEEPPYCGSPIDCDWPGYHTHWTEIPVPHLKEGLTMNHQDNLLPCPFCGGKAKPSYNGIRSMVFCTACSAQIRSYDSADEAIAAWNTRTPPPPKEGQS